MENVRWILLLLVIVILFMQIKIWVSKDGYQQMSVLQNSVDTQIKNNIFLEDRNKEKVTKKNILISFQSLSKTFNEVYKYKKIFNFLIARLFYNDGLVTIFALGGIYAIGTIGFSMKEVLVLGIVLNIFAAIGSFVFGHLEDKIGVSKVINISLVFLIV